MYGYRKLKDVLSKNKWTFLISFWSTAIICLHLKYVPHTRFDEDLKIPTPPRPSGKIKYYDLLLNGYMRGGSTLTGIVFGHRADSFYLYEPMWKICRWAYWHGNETICRADRLECRHLDPGQAVKDKSFVENFERYPPGSLAMAIKILRKTYDCLFNDYAQTVIAPAFNPKLRGPSWNKVTSCLRNKINYESCFMRHMPRICKDSMHKVTKVLRLTTDLMSSIIRSRDNLKVIHLFRDPRAIINSRIVTEWYPSKTDESAIANAKSLCNKMLYDFRKGQRVQKLYPDRFKFIYYEDFSVDILNKTKTLYNYLGMSVDEKYYPEIMKLPVFGNVSLNPDESERKKNSAFWWRKSLKWSIVEKMEEICKDVYKELGFRSFRNIQEYQDMSIPSLVIPKQYLIV